MQIVFSVKNEIRCPENAASMFPGAAMLPDGSIIVLFSSGSSFESSDSRLYQARSYDNGQNWMYTGRIYEDVLINSAVPFTGYAKPVLLPDGTCAAVGYGFFRDRPEMGLSDYAEKFGRFPEVKNFVLRSSDNGQNWSAPQWIEHSFPGMEISGPPLVDRGGKIHFFAAPFTLEAQSTGYSFASADGGMSWEQNGEFFHSDHIVPWETRSVELPSGRIVLVIWAFDMKEQKHLSNHLIWSDDGGRNWSAPFDTKLRGQAANFFTHEGKLYLLQARREGTAPGLYLNRISFTPSDTVVCGSDICLWNACGMANQSGRIEQQFAALKFGQPSVLPLSGGEYLLFFWSCVEQNYSVQAWKFRFED